MREWVRFFVGDLFQIHRLEHYGYAAVGLVLLLIIAGVNYLVPRLVPPPPADSATLARAWQALEEKSRLRIIHPFDPNTVSDTFLRAMNVPEGVIRQWMRYRKWGHRFRKSEDLWRLPAMDSALWQQLRPALIFPAPQGKRPSPRPPQAPPPPPQDLNRATAEDLAPHVPPWLARRVIKYRNALGGFVAWDQVREVYGVRPENIRTLRRRFFLPDTPFRKIPINRASFYKLRGHPYISDRMARRLVEWRRWNGRIPSVDTLAALWPADTLRRLRPYLTIE